MKLTLRNGQTLENATVLLPAYDFVIIHHEGKFFFVERSFIESMDNRADDSESFDDSEEDELEDCEKESLDDYASMYEEGEEEDVDDYME